MTTELMSTNGSGSLRAALEKCGRRLKDLTVLAPQNDPYRLDTPSGHRDGAWLANALANLGITGRRHLRGLHYILVSGEVVKPNGLPYTNTDDDWEWMSAKAAKAARWNRYIPFTAIIDQRNDEPVIRRWIRSAPEPYLTVDMDVVIPDADDLTPRIGLNGFNADQPYRLVIVGEKSSLRDVLDPISERYSTDLYLPTGESTISRHADLPDGRRRCPRRAADGGLLLRRLRPLGVADGDQREPQAAGAARPGVRRAGPRSASGRADTGPCARVWLGMVAVDVGAVRILAAAAGRGRGGSV